jgi:hypothetical protein
MAESRRGCSKIANILKNLILLYLFGVLLKNSQYLNSEALRQEIEEGLNVIENWNSANNFIWYGKGGEIAVNNKEDQELAILSLHLLQICMVYVNTLFVQKILSDKEWIDKMQSEDFRGLTPLFYSHVNPYGRLVLDMNERIFIEE